MYNCRVINKISHKLMTCKIKTKILVNYNNKTNNKKNKFKIMNKKKRKKYPFPVKFKILAILINNLRIFKIKQ